MSISVDWLKCQRLAEPMVRSKPHQATQTPVYIPPSVSSGLDQTRDTACLSASSSLNPGRQTDSIRRIPAPETYLSSLGPPGYVNGKNTLHTAYVHTAESMLSKSFYFSRQEWVEKTCRMLVWWLKCQQHHLFLRFDFGTFRRWFCAYFTGLCDGTTRDNTCEQLTASPGVIHVNSSWHHQG